MGGFLRFLAWFALLVAGFVLVALPLLLGPILTQMVRDMGLRADDLRVSVALFDPLLILGRSRQVTLSPPTWMPRRPGSGGFASRWGMPPTSIARSRRSQARSKP